MPEPSDVKVFISWSGELAKLVAIALREWFPLLFDRVKPWASDTDIAAGQRGLAQIEAELTDTSFGVVVVTAENQHAPWLNFEAGALSKTVNGDADQRVVPLLIDLTSPTQLTGPLAQFQSKLAQEEGILDMVRSLSAVAGIDAAVMTTRFEAHWPQLKNKIEKAKKSTATQKSQPAKRGEADVLDEILLHVRALRSEGEKIAARGSLEVSRESMRDRGFYRFLSALAEQHKLRIDKFPDIEDSENREVVLSPIGDYSPEAAWAFERELRQNAAPRDRGIEITVMPF